MVDWTIVDDSRDGEGRLVRYFPRRDHFHEKDDDHVVSSTTNVVVAAVSSLDCPLLVDDVGANVCPRVGAGGANRDSSPQSIVGFLRIIQVQLK